MFQEKSYEELVSIINDEKNITVTNQEECITALKSHGYFNLINNYKREIEVTLKNKDVKFYELIYLREIDNDLQSIIFKYLIRIENTLKSHLSYFLANNFGPCLNQYTNPENYSNHARTDKIFRDIKNKPYINFNKNPGKHYMENYNDLPPWVYLKHIPMGDTIKIFEQLKAHDKELIIEDWFNLLPLDKENKIRLLISLLKYNKDFRDSIAHGGRLLNYESSKKINHDLFMKILSPKVINKKEMRKYQGKFFLLLISIVILLPTRRDRQRFFIDIKSIYRMYINETENHFMDMFLSVAGLPDNFISRIETAINWDIPVV